MAIRDHYVNEVSRYEMCNLDDLYSKRDKYFRYKEKFQKALDCVDQGYPMYIDIELNNYCNMKCKMCIKNFDENANGKDNMELSTLDKILNEANKMGVPSFFIGGGTECLVNPNIKYILRQVRKIGRGIDDVLITNGYKLTPDISDFLIDMQWEKVFVSLDAATAKTYQLIRGRELEIVESNLDHLIQKKKERNSNFPIIRVSFVIQPENQFEKKQFFDKWKDKVQIIDYQTLMDYSSLEIKKNLPKIVSKCNAPFNRLYIDCYGNIYPCCVEWSKYYLLGNVKYMTLQEAWNCKKIVELRRSLIDNRHNDICKNCLSNCITII